MLFLRKLASKKLPKLYREYRKLLDREKQIENGYKFKERKYNDPEFRAVRNRIQNIMKKYPCRITLHSEIGNTPLTNRGGRYCDKLLQEINAAE